ncbi:MAG: DUF1993 domain-containing protein [Myxococcota bacterium]
MYYTIIKQMKKGLGQLDSWLVKATTHATAKGYDPNVLANMRLAPDQFDFKRQVQIACDTAKLASARMTGKEAPKHDDHEKTIDELRARIASTVGWLDQLGADDFAGAGERVISQPRWEGKTMTGADYFVEHAVPNFFFHLTTAYAILRHNGVELGKRDYLGPLSLK